MKRTWQRSRRSEDTSLLISLANTAPASVARMVALGATLLHKRMQRVRHSKKSEIHSAQQRAMQYMQCAKRRKQFGVGLAIMWAG